jgi:cytochrome oxidase Cu insertion factor (SCO1/SenC/PrrC family)
VGGVGGGRCLLETVIGLHGDPDELASVKSAYGVLAQPDEPAGDGHDHDHEGEGAASHEHGGDDYTVTHTSRVFLIDPEGRLVTNYTMGTPNEEIIADITFLLEQ